ncbi:MAG: RHS repeat protein, partial [Planctomycetes bacterium]|nr:RHS repeat protein [Planctomycetota bacterium]
MSWKRITSCGKSVLVALSLLGLSRWALAQYAPAFEEHEEAYHRGRTHRPKYLDAAGMLVRPPQLGPTTSGADILHEKDDALSAPGAGAGSGDAWILVGACGGSEGGGDAEPEGANASQDGEPRLGTPEGAGGPGTCPGGLAWNASPSFKTNPLSADLNLENPSNLETDAGNGWFLDRPRIPFHDTAQGGRNIHVRWNAHIYRKYYNGTTPFDPAAGWKGSKHSSDEVIYQYPYPGGDYTLFDGTGKAYLFDATTTILKEVRAPGGERLVIATSGQFTTSVEKRDASGTLLLRWAYSYEPANPRLVSKIEVTYNALTTPFRTITLKHKLAPDGPEQDASRWDLVGIEDRWTPTGTEEEGGKTLNWAFRYYTAPWSSQLPGHPYQLRAVIGPYSSRRFQAANPTLNIHNEPWATVSAYVDKRYEYYADAAEPNPDNRTRVSKVILRGTCGGCGGSGADGEHLYEYHFNSSPPPAEDLNVWRYMVKVTLPLGLGATEAPEKLIWHNSYGQKIAERFTQSNAPPLGPSGKRTWCWTWTYDTLARATEIRSPEAVASIGINPDYSPSISLQSGLATRYLYTEWTDPGPVTYRSLEVQAWDGGATAVPLSKVKWQLRTSGSEKAYFLVESTVYPEGGPGISTTYANWFYSDKPLALWVRKTTHPALDSYGGEPPRPAVEEWEHFRKDCLRNWHEDGEGYVHHTVYDPATRLPTKTWGDIDTTSPPAGAEPVPMLTGQWDFHRNATAPPINAATAFEHDGLARRTAQTGPDGRREEWVYESLSGGEQVTLYYTSKPAGAAPEGPTHIAVTDPTLHDKPVASGLAYLTQGRDSNVRDDWDASLANLGQVAETAKWKFYLRGETSYTDAGAVQVVKELVDPENPGSPYNDTTYLYDSLGRPSEVENPVGTRTFYARDDLGRVWQTSVGTSGANARVVETRVYDAPDGGTVHGVGNGKVTRVDRETGVPNDPPRKTWLFHDWRDRVTTEIVLASAGPPPRYRVTKSTYDEIGQETVTEVFDSTSVDPEAPAPDIAPDPSELKSHVESDYDEWQDRLETRVYEVSGPTLDPAKHIPERLWRDKRGILVKHRANGTVYSKIEVDGLGRAFRHTTSVDPDGETGWALDLTDDIVVEEVHLDLTPAGHRRFVKSYSRLPSAPDTARGLLSSLSSSYSRLSATLYWRDTLDRETHEADYGKSPPAWQPTPPTYSDPLALLQLTAYDPESGWARDVTSPAQHVTHYDYDGLGRVTQVTENHDPLAVALDKNRVRQLQYDAMGRVTQMTAVNLVLGGSGLVSKPQHTAYEFGVTEGTDSSTITSADPLYRIRHPDPLTGNPSASPSDQETFGYNRQGELVWRKDQNGTQHSITRDVEGRVTDDSLSAIGAGVDSFVVSIRSTFDGLGRLLTVASYGAGSIGRNLVLFQHGPYGEVTKIIQDPTGLSSSAPFVLYSFQRPVQPATPSFRLASTTFPDGTLYTESYSGTVPNLLNRPAGKTKAGSPVFTERYEGLRRVVERTLGGSGSVYYRTPDDYGRVETIRLYGGAFGTYPSNMVEYGYCYNKDSQAVFREEKANTYCGTCPSAQYPFDERYTYDGLGRLLLWERGCRGTGSPTCQLTSGCVAETRSWTLDQSNNWTAAVNYQNELDGYPYDSNGNFKANGGGYVYDGWNRLVSITQSGYNYGTFRYNGLGQLVSQQTAFSYYNHSNDQYYYDLDGRLIEER